MITDLSVECGKITDNTRTLRQLCEKEAVKLAGNLELDENSAIEVPFWTSDFPELICVGTFKKENNTISFNLDFSQGIL